MTWNAGKSKSQGIALLYLILFMFVDFGCHSSSDDNGSSSDTGRDMGGVRLEVRLQGESVPAAIDRFEVSVTGPDIPLFDTNRIAVGDSPVALGLGDLNGDGALDVVTANNDSNDVSIFLGQGGSVFIPQPRVNVGRGPLAISVVRFDDDNGDGKVDLTDFPDLVTANSADNDISVVLNTEILRNIRADQETVLVTIDGRATRAFQLTLQEQIPLGSNRSFFVRAFLPGSTTPAFEGRATADILSPNTRVIVNLNRL